MRKWFIREMQIKTKMRNLLGCLLSKQNKTQKQTTNVDENVEKLKPLCIIDRNIKTGTAVIENNIVIRQKN